MPRKETMKRSSSSTPSSANLKKPTAAPKGAALVRRKKLTNARTALQGLNGIVSCSNGNNDSSFPSSASTSIEAPKGCLRFFLSISSSSAKAKTTFSNRSGAVPGTPGSAPATKPKKKPNPENCNRKSRTCSVSSNVEANPIKKKQAAVLAELDLCNENATRCTPVSKIPGGSRLGSGLRRGVDKNCDDTESKTKTPPIEASVSPEIQCGGLNVYSTAKMALGTELLQTCYGTGHVLSGITDKRKCKPRGILTMIDDNREFNDASSIFGSACANDDEGSGAAPIGQTSGLSPVPLPCEASMHWLSPCREKGENDQKSKSPAQRLQELASASLPSSPLLSSGARFSSDVYSKSSLSSTGNSRRESSAPARPLQGLLDFQGFVASMYGMPSPSPMTPILSSSTTKEGRKCSPYDEQEENVFSAGSFGSGNVIQTPHSDSVSKNSRENKVDSEVDLMAQAFDRLTLSPEKYDHHLSTWDPADMRFQLDYLNTPCNFIDMAQVQKVLDSKAASWVSNCTSDFVPSQDSLRISWRDGLVSRIFEMDEYDCCRCFSDEEEEDSNVKLHHSPEQIGGTKDNKKPGSEQPLETDSYIQSMSLDSMSSDGGRLIASDDSSWNLCYKNRLFEV